MKQGFQRVKTIFETNIWLQILWIVGIWWACQNLVRITHFPLPGGVLGLLILVVALLKKWLSPIWIHRGAASLIQHMALFFLPALVAIVSHPEFFGWLGVKFIIAVLAGTLVVMIGTALIVDLCFHWMKGGENLSATKPAGEDRAE